MEWGWGSSWGSPSGWSGHEGWGNEPSARWEEPDAWSVTGHGTSVTGQGPWWSQQRSESKDWAEDKEKVDKYKNVTTFGCTGRKPLPLEERKDVFLALVFDLVPNATLGKIAVAAWSAEVTMAAFWIVSKTGPKTPLRWLKDDAGTFSVENAVKVLKSATHSLYQSEEELLKVISFVTQHAWSNTEEIISMAVEQGFDPSDCLDPKQQALAQALGIPASGSSASGM